MIQPTLISLHPNECSQEFHYYPFVIKLTEDLYLSMFNMITTTTITAVDGKM